jgi:mycofactocin system FadH/OYE family oxidoreductase 2
VLENERSDLSNLFVALPMGHTELPNRICFLAHRTNFGRQGLINDRHVAYYQRRAQGGCGLIIVGELSISANDFPYESVIAAYRPEVVEGFYKLTQAVHQFDTRIFAQLSHHGFQSSGHITRNAVWAPSAMADIVYGETGKTMEEEDIRQLLQAFSDAAEQARSGGFDGVQIDMGPESLLRQFLSPISNHRQDKFGGSIENRIRLPLMAIDAVRRAVGTDFTVGIQLCVDEKFWGGINTEESTQFARLFEQSGHIDYIQTTLATYYNLYLVNASMHTPAGCTLDLAEKVKQNVSLPVIAAHQIDFPHMAAKALAGNKADAVGFVRPLICDPDMTAKARVGRIKDIRHCARDNLACVGRVNQSKSLACVQNPDAGRESSIAPKAAKVQRPEKIMVIGAGPAGMAAARTAAQRGYSVTIYEKDGHAGGQVKLAQQGAGRGGMAWITRNQQEALTQLGVPIIFNSAMSVEKIMALQPDAVIVATGCVPLAKPYPGEYGPPVVLTLWDVLQNTFPVGDKVLFIDEIGNHQTLASAELLAEQGKKVDLVTSDLFVGVGIATLGDLYFTRQRLLQRGVRFQTDLLFERIDGNRLVAQNVYTTERVVFEGYDTLIVASGYAADDRLYYQLKGKVTELHRAGDCVAPRGIEMAIYEGEKVGNLL